MKQKKSENQRFPKHRLFIPKYPFRANTIRAYDFRSLDNPNHTFNKGGGRKDFTPEEEALLRKACGGKINLANLRAYLVKHCNIQNPQDYDFKNIFAAIRLAEGGKNQAEGTEQPWRENAEAYLPNSEALKLTDNKMTLAKLNRLLKPDGRIRYMRKGQRCKVHIQDFRAYLYLSSLTDIDINELCFKYMDTYFEGVKKRLDAERAQKQKK